MNRDPNFVTDAQGRICHVPQPFDEYDDGLMRDVCGERLAEPVQALLVTLSQIKTTLGSFGVDKSLAFDMLLPDLEKLRKACVEEWGDM